MRTIIIFFLGLLFSMPLLHAQSLAPKVGVGQWESFLPYGQTKALIETPDHIYAATDYGLFSVFKASGEFALYNKITGLSDVGISTLAYSPAYQRIFIGYENGNLDILGRDGSVMNRPAIKQNANISSGRSIRHIFCDSNQVYLSTEFGLVCFNQESGEFAQTTFTSMEVYASERLAEELFIATAMGIYKISTTGANLQDFNNWRKLGTADGLAVDFYESFALGKMNGRLYADINDTLMRYDGQQFSHLPYDGNSYMYTGRSKLRMQLNAFDSRLTIATGTNYVEVLFEHEALDEYFFDGNISGNISDAISDRSSAIWIAGGNGLYRNNADGSLTAYQPEGPFNANISSLGVDDYGVLWATGGLLDYITVFFDGLGAYRYEDFDWKSYRPANRTELSGVDNLSCLAIHPQDRSVYMGSFLAGLVQITKDDSIYVWDKDSPNTALQAAEGDISRTRITGLAFDEDNNLWMSNHKAVQPIVVKTEDGDWKSFASPYTSEIGPIAVDRFGYKWIVQLRGNNILVFDSGELEVDGDEQYKVLTPSNSELASSKVNCVVSDRSGSIWVGTDDGVTIFNCSVFDSNCPGLRPIINPDDFNGRLLENENIRSIAVDGANRKWIASDNGVFLLDGEDYSQIYYFTEENSPLFNNRVGAIAVDPESGQVYMATESGLQGFRAEATQGSSFANKSAVQVYPNPVRPTYDGPIAIRGLVENTNVKITDVNGQLVFEQEAYGGQAVWDGYDYQGQKASPGVYLVFTVNDDGTERLNTKFLIVN
ncbi:two-component regulator propeller domain-containing protein [Saprospira sp. CCB-QB6]|uniref:type IX secretion system anionic LPS delivery protein PorZ n=1 Tax=Saprospira sp. CCB-QB6 TaxID=3023936 RepID=UPI002349CCC3|nr:two-component regulator propeller domain-containing protein [Saprospira sp. CCB-QB6]WCL80113.1 two-component regulator propeller domain-containing protein [Saprospira sp. CCB-QB6]